MITLEYLRHFRLGGYAIFDFIMSFLGFYLLAPLLSKLFKKIRIDIPKINWLYLTLPIGVLTHLLVGTITPMTRDFMDVNGHYFLKVVILGLLIMGLRGIRMTRREKE